MLEFSLSSTKEGKGAIVATIGPASDTPEMLEKMLQAGLDVVRLNLSHGKHEDAKKRFETVRDVNDSIPILFDLSGPKIRIGEMEKAVVLRKDDELILTKEEIMGHGKKVSVSYKDLIDFAIVGNSLFLNDGLIRVEVVEKSKDNLITKVIHGGPLSSRKGINAPDIGIKLFSPTDKDIKDLDFTLGLEPDFYSVSFVRRAEDIETVRAIISSSTDDRVPLISKIEHKDAVLDIKNILKASDGIMVARGDLGVELPPEEVPMLQEQLVNMCKSAAKQSIVATQMLESMVVSPRATRAETSDVANAILQGADAVMLSAETATGEYPVEAIAAMDRIILTTQSYVPKRMKIGLTENPSIAESIGQSAVQLADGLDVDYIIAYTRSGSSSSLVSKFRPNQPIISVTPSKATSRRLRLQWGVFPLYLGRDFTDTDEMIHAGIQMAYDEKMIEKESKCVVVAGSLLGLPWETNLIQYYEAETVISSLEAAARFAKAYSIVPGDN